MGHRKRWAAPPGARPIEQFILPYCAAEDDIADASPEAALAADDAASTWLAGSQDAMTRRDDKPR